MQSATKQNAVKPGMPASEKRPRRNVRSVALHVWTQRSGERYGLGRELCQSAVETQALRVWVQMEPSGKVQRLREAGAEGRA